MKARAVIGAVWNLLVETARSFDRNRGFQVAATLAFFCFFSLFPLLLLALYLLGHFVVSSEQAMRAMEETVARVFPVFNKVVTHEIRSLAEHRGWGVASLLILLWSVTPLAESIRNAFTQIFRLDRSLSYWKTKTVDVMAVLLMLIVLILLMMAEITYAAVIHRIPDPTNSLPRLLELLVPFALTLVFFVFFDLAFVPVRLRWGALLAGCMVTAGLLSLIRPAFVAFLQFNPDYGFTFGSLKAVFLILIWVYYAFVVVLFGTELTANVRRRDALLVRDLLSASTEGDMRRFAARLSQHAHDYPVGQVLFREGDMADALYFVVSGSVDLWRGGVNLRTMRIGEFFGEMGMLVGAPRAATALVAAEGARVITISYENMGAVFRENPQIVMKLLKEMAQRLQDADDLLTGPPRPLPGGAAGPGLSPVDAEPPCA